MKTKLSKDRGGTLIDAHDLQNVWRRAAKKVKLWQVGLGPHQLRSSFKSQCNRCEIAYPVSEFCMGHGGGDRYGYSRETLDERYMAKELAKFWEPTTVNKEEVDQLQDQLQQQAEYIMYLKDVIPKLQEMAKASQLQKNAKKP
jgi:hypothetical protein